MGRVVVVNHLTLDGVLQGPAGPDEDPRGGFTAGGWAAERVTAAVTARIGERIADRAGFLLGRRTYEQFSSVWPQRRGDPMGTALTQAPKYVASRTLSEPLPWANSVLLTGDAVTSVAALRERVQGALVVFGSGALVRSLLPAGLIDELLLIIHPIVLGRGQRLFGEDRVGLRLLDALTTETGVFMGSYAPAPAPGV